MSLLLTLSNVTAFSGASIVTFEHVFFASAVSKSNRNLARPILLVNAQITQFEPSNIFQISVF